MPVRLRITLLFASVVFLIMSCVCLAVYYFSYTARIESIKTRLTNRAITTGRMLNRSELFDREMVERIDSFTTISFKNKSVQAFTPDGRKIYHYTEVANDTVPVTQEMITDVIENGTRYSKDGMKETIAYYYELGPRSMVVFCTALDVVGLNNLAHLRNILGLSFVGGLIITIFGGYFFSRQLLRPIKTISKDVTEISAQSLTRRIHTGNYPDEWHQLAATFNELLDRLQESFELQRRFIANASHELSTPLTSISSQLEIALQRERSIPHYENVLASVLQDVKRMNKLTLTLLEFAKATGDKGGLNISLIRIDEILMELPATLRRQNNAYEVYLNFEKLPDQEEDLLVLGNSELLFTAIHNIAANACKYSPNHRAEIYFSIRDTFFEISISDNGPGIPDAEIQNIFEPFYRVDNKYTPKGFGLGLSLAHKIIKLHKGELRVRAGIPAGTTFVVIIPSNKQAGS